MIFFLYGACFFTSCLCDRSATLKAMYHITICKCVASVRYKAFINCYGTRPFKVALNLYGCPCKVFFKKVTKWQTVSHWPKKGIFALFFYLWSVWPACHHKVGFVLLGSGQKIQTAVWNINIQIQILEWPKNPNFRMVWIFWPESNYPNLTLRRTQD